MYGLDWNDDFNNRRTRWMSRTSWQALTSATRSKLFKPLAYFPATLLLFSYVMQLSDKVGLKLPIPPRMLYTGGAYLFYAVLLLLIYFSRPAVIAAKLEHIQNKWNPVDRMALIRGWGYSALQDEIAVVKINWRDLPYLEENEKEVIVHLIKISGKPYPYYGLKLSGTELIRELAAAAAKSRMGKVHENFTSKNTWQIINGRTDVVVYSNAPKLYECEVFSRNWRDVPDFSDDIDIGLLFWVAGRNMAEPTTKVNIVSEFVHGVGELFERSSVDSVLDILAQNASCKRPFMRAFLWILLSISVILFTIATFIQFQAAFSRILAASS